MFKIFIGAVISISICFCSYGQKRKFVYADNRIVKDSAGKIYPEEIWRKLLLTGYYSIKPENPGKGNSNFILVRLTDAERERKLSAVKPKESKSDFVNGEQPAGFSTSDIAGDKYKLKDLKGKVVVLNFWFINCTPCRAEIPELNKLVQDYSDSSNIIFLAIALDSKSDLKGFLKKEPFNYKIIDNGQDIANQYNIAAYPTHVIINKEGKVYFHTQGGGASTVFWLRKSVGELMRPVNIN